MESMLFWQSVGSILQSFLAAAAIVVGGTWTYMLFVRQRLAFPRMQVAIVPHPVSIRNGWILHAVAQLTNSGSVIARISSAEMHLRIVLPLPQQVQADVDVDRDPVREGETEIPWPMLAGRTWDSKTHPIELEPGESDTLHADFFVPGHVSVIQFYLFVANAKKRRRGLGWTTTTIYKMPDKENSVMSDSEKQKPLHEEQRQQVKQSPQQQTQPRPNQEKTGQQDKKK